MERQQCIRCYIHPEFEYKQLLRMFLKENVSLNIDLNRVEHRDDIVVCFNDLVEDAKEVLNWEKINSSFLSYVKSTYMRNYDGFFLKNAVMEAQNKKVDTLIVGSSYPQKGILDNELTCCKAKNLAMGSQDYYYGCRLAEKVLERNHQIKKIIIGGGYYTIFCDLSRTAEIGVRLVADVYYPILKDVHNTLILPERITSIESCIWNFDYIVRLFSEKIYRKNSRKYFNAAKTRFEDRNVFWQDTARLWYELSDEERRKAAEKVTEGHNKFLKYTGTYKENIHMLKEFALMCEALEVDVWMVIFPSSEEYLTGLNPEYRVRFYEAMNTLNGKVHLMDFNDNEEFKKDDFDDADHLSEKGARKATAILNMVMKAAE